MTNCDSHKLRRQMKDNSFNNKISIPVYNFLKKKIKMIKHDNITNVCIQ